MKVGYVNSFLVQANLPRIDHKNLIETLSVVCDRIAKVYAGREIRSKVAMKAAEAQVPFFFFRLRLSKLKNIFYEDSCILLHFFRLSLRII